MQITLLDEAITAAVAAVIPDVASRAVGNLGVESITLQAVFDYGSGGTTAKAWVQTTFDGGVSWIDIASFAFTTADAVRLYHLTAAAVTSIATPTDGSLADNTAVNGLLGSDFRVKLTTTGTYAATTLVVTAVVR